MERTMDEEKVFMQRRLDQMQHEIEECMKEHVRREEEGEKVHKEKEHKLKDEIEHLKINL